MSVMTHSSNSTQMMGGYEEEKQHILMCWKQFNTDNGGIQRRKAAHSNVLEPSLTNMNDLLQRIIPQKFL
jgi:hypothetical protein